MAATVPGAVRRLRRAVLALLMAAALPAMAQSPLATYEGADRMERLIAAAKKEGTLTLYTTIAEKDLPTLIKPFETRYGIKVNVWRASASCFFTTIIGITASYSEKPRMGLSLAICHLPA